MGHIREKMKADLELRGLATSTQEAYLHYAHNFVAYHRRSPSEMGKQEIRDFLLRLVTEKRAGAATHRMYLAAIKFLYATTLGRPEEVANIPWPKKSQKLPDVLTGEEVERLFRAVQSVKHRAILMTAYGAGLRISEACSLQINDIDSRRMLIHVRDGKGSKDRYVMLSERLLGVLRAYCKCVHPRRPYLFPGIIPGRPITPGAVQGALREVLVGCHFSKRVTAHSLRHGFATHLLELGNDIRTIQRLLGHASIQTTARYTKVTVRHIGRIKSPLDVLQTKNGRLLA